MRRLQSPRMQTTLLRARASHRRRAGGDWRRRAALRSARRDARALEREDVALARTYASHDARGHRVGGGATREAGRAPCARDRRLRRAEMKLHAAVARCVGRAYVTAPPTRASAREAEAWLRSQGVRSPEKMARALAPGVVWTRRRRHRCVPPRQTKRVRRISSRSP